VLLLLFPLQKENKPAACRQNYVNDKEEEAVPHELAPFLDDDVELIGVLNETDFIHYQGDCLRHPFALGAEVFCLKCYCFPVRS
jgi:hypothetical protein